MSKRNLINLFLFFIILILIGLVIYEPGKDLTTTPPKLTKLKSSDIQRIKISRNTLESSEKNIEFIFHSNEWKMVKPYQTSANSFRIESILKLLSAVSLSKNSLEGLNKKTFGLDKPLAAITFNNNLNIIFGHNKSLKNHRYIQIGSMLHMVADTFYYQVSAKSESYIDHKLLPKKSKIIKLTLPNFVLENKKAKWNRIPAAGETSSDAINQLISEWQLSQAYDIKIEKPEPKSQANIVISLDKDKSLYFKTREENKNFTLKNVITGIRYIMSADRKDKLLALSDINQEN